MSRHVRFYQIDAFTRHPLSGNPAGVVPEADGLSTAAMQAIARELNNSETAFILPPRDSSHDVHVRFFTPTTEVPVCGHATIAAHWVRASEGVRPGIYRQLCGAGILPIEIQIQGDGQRLIWMTQRPAKFVAPIEGATRTALLAALRVASEQVANFAPIQVVSTGHSKVMIPLTERATLDELKPDLAALAQLSANIGCNGYYPFVLHGRAQSTQPFGRMFAPAIGIAEDPVTGNASGPLGAYLLRHGLIELDADRHRTLEVRQGEAMGRPGSVRVEVSRKGGPESQIDVRVAGNAVLAFKSVIEINL